MAEEKKEDLGELCHVSLCKAENGWKISCSYKSKETLSSRAGWVPCMPGENKEYIASTKDAVLKRLKEVL